MSPAPVATTHPRNTTHPEVGPPLLALGVDFRTAPIELRERVALDPREAEALQLRLMASSEIAEAFVLSTCNRTELYLRPEDGDAAFKLALDRALGERAPEIVEGGRYFVLHDREAARRLLAVAAGLESMVLGEPEILGQVKQAADLAADLGSTGPILQRLLRTAMKAGRRARSETEIGAGAISLGYAVVELARRIFDRIDHQRALLVGAGDMATLAATALFEREILSLAFANRGNQRAERFQEEFPQSERLAMEERYQYLAVADLLVVATRADEPIFTLAPFREVVQRRRSRPLLVVDLGLPRNVEAEIGSLPNVFLHDIDSLRGLIDRNLDRRRAEVPAVESIVGTELRHFLDWYERREAEPLVAQLQRQAEGIRRREVELAKESIPAEYHEELDRLTRSLVRRVLHHPSRQLRHGVGEGSRAHLELIRRLFQLDEEREP